MNDHLFSGLNQTFAWLLIFVLPSIARTQTASTTDGLSQARSDALQEKLPQAEAETRKYLAQHNDSGAAHFLLGYILYRQVKARESLAEFTEGAKYLRPSAGDLRVVGADYVILSDFGDADKWFTKATEWEPQNALGWYYLGRTKYNENRFEEAVKAFEQCLKLSPNHVRAEDNLGLSLQALGRMEEAQEAFGKAIAWQEVAGPAKNGWPYIDMGSFLLESNQPEKAVPYLEKGIAILPDSSKAHQQLGKAYLSLHDLPRAQQQLETATRLAPESAPVHYMLGQLYEKQGLKDKAKGEFARYSQLNGSRSTEEDHEIHSVGPQ